MGCNHPDLWHQHRNSPTATRLGLMVLLQILASGQLYDMTGAPAKHRWRFFLGDIESAFLQGKNRDQKHP
eukprot:2288205-Lingulodinium_polyedra.AAC.1